MTASTTVPGAVTRWENHSWTNAFVNVDPDAVRTELDDAPPGPLHQMLFSVKDLFAVAGVASAAGSLVLRDYRPDSDATVVRRARQAGAVFFGKTNCSEFGFGTDTDTRLGGRVRHPFRDDISPGGSSGGDAVAVATGIVDFAIAGDYGGSARWPAQALGIYGLRPGVDILPGDGRVGGFGATREDPVGHGRAPWQLAAELETVGIMARTASTVAQAISPLSEVPLATGRHGRILVTTGSEIAPISDDVADAVGAAAVKFQEVGFSTEIADGLFSGALDAYSFLRSRLDDHSDVRRLVRGSEKLLCAETLSVLDAAPSTVVIDDAVRDTYLTAARLRRRLHAAFSTCDAILMPCAPTGAVGFAERVTVAGREIGGHDLMAHLRAVSLTGLPALTVPVGLGRDGRPISVQLVGAPRSELVLCELAQELSATATALDGRNEDQS